MMNSRTIAAIATAVSPSGVGIIRISGKDAFDVIRKIFRKKSGKQYFENHQNDFEECFAAQFSAIRESQEKIKEFEQQIADIKGVI